jgi:hypothetical protein
MQWTLPWTAATVHETTFVCILTAAVVPHDSLMDDYGGRQTTWGGAALGGVADQGEGAALAPRGTAYSKTPSSGKGLPEDSVSNGAIRTQLKMLISTRMWNTSRSEHVTEELKPCLSLCRAQSGAVELRRTRYTC